MGGSGGNSMLKTVGRVVARATVTTTNTSTASTASANSTASRPTHKPNSSNLLSLSSASSPSPFSPHNLAPISATSTPPTTPPSCPPFTSPSYCDEFEWLSVDGSTEDELPCGLCDDFVFGSVPSEDEVRNVLFDLQQALGPSSDSQFIKEKFARNSDKEAMDAISSPTGGSILKVPSISESDWREPSLQLCNPMVSQTNGSNRVYDAFHLLQTDTAIQRMVISLSSDNTVWDAVLNNEVVKELRELFYEDENNALPSSAESVANDSLSSLNEISEQSNAATSILKWIFDGPKTKVMELVEKILNLMNDLFQAPNSKRDKATTEATADPFMQKLRGSFTVYIVVLLIVVLTRTHRT